MKSALTGEAKASPPLRTTPAIMNMPPFKTMVRRLTATATSVLPAPPYDGGICWSGRWHCWTYWPTGVGVMWVSGGSSNADQTGQNIRQIIPFSTVPNSAASGGQRPFPVVVPTLLPTNSPVAPGPSTERYGRGLPSTAILSAHSSPWRGWSMPSL